MPWFRGDSLSPLSSFSSWEGWCQTTRMRSAVQGRGPLFSPYPFLGNCFRSEKLTGFSLWRYPFSLCGPDHESSARVLTSPGVWHEQFKRSMVVLSWSVFFSPFSLCVWPIRPDESVTCLGPPGVFPRWFGSSITRKPNSLMINVYHEEEVALKKKLN